MPMNKHLVSMVAAVLMLLSASVACRAAAQQIVPAWLRTPGGIVTDTSDQVAFVIRAKGNLNEVAKDSLDKDEIEAAEKDIDTDAVDRGVDAVDLATGSMLWHKHGYLTPLLVVGQKLFALAESNPATNELHIVALDTRSGHLIFVSKPVVFPKWVTTSGSEHTFTDDVYVEQNGLFFRWFASYYPVGSALEMESNGEYRGPRDAGIARVDLTTGDVTMLPRPLPGPRVDAHIIDVPQRTFLAVEGKPVHLSPHVDKFPCFLRCFDAALAPLWDYPLKPIYRSPGKSMPPLKVSDK